jgi:5-methylcytosine-specific restriction endonuclease McrA
MGKKYKKLLKDPRWQKKRLKVFERAGWMCERCGDSKSELHVHHTFYDGRKPWKYPKSSLECLCKSCHEAEHFVSDDVLEDLDDGEEEEECVSEEEKDSYPDGDDWVDWEQREEELTKLEEGKDLI